MRVEVDQELCISCGLCVDDCPNIFQWNDDGKAVEKEKDVPSGMEDEVKDAVEGCPTEAIKEI